MKNLKLYSFSIKKVALTKIILCFTILSNAQENIFLNSNPVNNIDSLEIWLKENPAPNITRLRNLYKLEKSYFWQLRNESVLEEIGGLSNQLNNKPGKGLYLLIKALLLNKGDKNKEAKQYFVRAMDILEKENDPTLRLITYAFCCSMVIDSKGGSDNIQAKQFLEKASKYYDRVANPHDKIIFLLLGVHVENFSKNPDKEKILQNFTQVTKMTSGKKEFDYFINQMEMGKMGDYIYVSKNYKDAILLGESIEKRIDKKNYFFIANLYYFLGIAYHHQNMPDKADFAFQEALNYYPKFNISNLYTLANGTKYEFKITIFDEYRAFAKTINNKTLALALSDSVILYKTLEAKEINDKAIVEIQEQYNSAKSENEKQLALLEAKQEAQENNRLYWYLGFAVLLLLILIYLLYRLSHSNKKQKKLILFRDQFYTIFTHDIRKSINSLAMAGSMLNQLILQKKNEEIKIITKQIDWMSNNTLQLVDNILDWGISNGYKIDNTPSQTNITEAIHEVFNNYKSSLAAKQIECNLMVEDNLIINTSKSCFEVIFRNTLSNAKNNTSAGGNIIVKAKFDKYGAAIVSIENTVEEIDYGKINYVNQIFSDEQLPAVGENGLGLGIILMKTYADKNQTKVMANISSKNSVTFSIILHNQSQEK